MSTVFYGIQDALTCIVLGVSLGIIIALFVIVRNRKDVNYKSAIMSFFVILYTFILIGITFGSSGLRQISIMNVGKSIAESEWIPNPWSWIAGFLSLLFGDIHGFVQISVNILIFIPMGIVAFICFKNSKHIKLYGTLFCCFISVIVEIMQLFTIRGTDVNDICLNAIGGFLGVLLTKKYFERKGMLECQKDEKDFVFLIITILVCLTTLIFFQEIDKFMWTCIFPESFNRLG